MKVKIEIEIEDAQIHELVRELIYTIEDVADVIDARNEENMSSTVTLITGQVQDNPNERVPEQLEFDFGE